ncbi:MAG: nitroreductase family protein [Actinomycetota bacterium]
MDAFEAIRHRRSVRRYTDRPVADRDLDRLLRLALLAPTGGMAQAWSLLVVRDPERRRALADIVIRGGAEYFRTVRRPAEGATPEQHAEWAHGYAQQALGTYPSVPVWILGLRVPRHAMPADQAAGERDSDMVSIGFAMENLFVAARAMGLGTVPTIFHLYLEDELRALLDLPPEVEVPVVSPLGYPEEFPVGLPPALASIRRPWRTLVHDEAWGNPRQAPDRGESAAPR